ncbi:hypothetical protein JRO89_XS04G0242500 [Xanthoceras sorbifolium]|uniref:Retrotransposon Copia-like N-terminal domain-containing protein n=1 Tax=Xanthoceras sorbifolium TaxID=99658 RepID=A0ABQ8I7B9_9ROSI|nr:hypothetical protein JRO89_XS04G0242500 [Xanthoceras sorbifolium]
MEAKFSKMISLNGTNYHIWRNKMKDLLFVTKMHLLVFTNIKPDGKTDEEWDFEHKQIPEGGASLENKSLEERA